MKPTNLSVAFLELLTYVMPFF